MNLEKIFIIVGVLIYVIFATSVFKIYLYLAMYFFKMHCAIYFSFWGENHSDDDEASKTNSNVIIQCLFFVCFWLIGLLQIKIPSNTQAIKIIAAQH